MTEPVVPLVEELARAAARLGGRALIVGGWVRDRLLGRTSKDIDVEVFGIQSDHLRALLMRFGPVNAVGESFTVYKVGGIDVSLPRRDSKTGQGHRGFTVEGDPTMSIADAARRRDFTINAISFDPLTREYIDPFNGRDDLRTRTLRAVDLQTFGEDSLRVLRAVQFAARFDCTLEPETRALCGRIPLGDLPAERVWGEIEKLLLQAPRPSAGLTLALDLGVIRQLFPELEALVGCPQEPEWHPEGDVWVHTLMVVDEARTRIDDLTHARKVTVMLAALCHDLGKPPTTAVIDGRIRSMDHEQAGVAPAARLLDRLNVHTLEGFDVRSQVLGMVAHHLKPLAFAKAIPQAGDGAFRRLALKVDLELLALVAESDCRGRTGDFNCEGIRWFLERARALGVQHAAPDPVLMGRHLLALGVRPGPGMGVILRQVYERQLDGRVTTVEEGIEAAREILAAPTEQE